MHGLEAANTVWHPDGDGAGVRGAEDRPSGRSRPIRMQDSSARERSQIRLGNHGKPYTLYRMDISRFEASLQAYLQAIAEDRRFAIDDRSRDRIARECRVGIHALARFRYAQAAELLGGDGGLEVLHDVLVDVMSGDLQPKEGEILRAISRAGYERFRRGKANRCDFHEIQDDAAAGPVTPSAITWNRRAPSGDGADLVEQLEDPSFQKVGGGLHLKRLAHARATTTRGLRREVSALAQRLGRDDARIAFCVARLAESFVALLQQELESTTPDLVPTAPERERTVVRARRILARLKFAAVQPERKLGVRLARQIVRERDYAASRLREAAIALGGDTFAIGLVDAERACADRKPDRAHARLDDLERRHAVSARSRRDSLLRVSRARCLMLAGRVHEASTQLEPVASVLRRDPLFSYNRFVLAIRTGAYARAQRSRIDLENALSRDDEIRPLLRSRIQRALSLSRAR